MVRNPSLVWDTSYSFLFLICEQRLVKLLDWQALSLPGIFTGEGTIQYTGCDSRAMTLVDILPGLCKGERLGSMFCTVMACITQGSTVTSQLGPRFQCCGSRTVGSVCLGPAGSGSLTFCMDPDPDFVGILSASDKKDDLDPDTNPDPYMYVNGVRGFGSGPVPKCNGSKTLCC